MTARPALSALLAAAGAAAAIAAAPTAFADPSCTDTNPGTGGQAVRGGVCESPGNAEIDGKLPPVESPGYYHGGSGGFPWDSNLFTL